MTEAQIRYHTMVETGRHNRAQEENWTAQLAETQRSNQANERLKAESNAISRYAVDVQKYGIETQAATSRYVANVQAAASRYAADKNAETQRYVSDQNVAQQRYATDTNAAVQMYKTQTENELAQQRLAFDRTTQLFKNAMDSKRYRLEQLRTTAQNSLSRAQTASVQAQTQKTLSDIRVSVEQLTLAAKQYGLQEEAAKYNNLLTQARTLEANNKAINEQMKTPGIIIDDIDKGIDLLMRALNLLN